ALHGMSDSWPSSYAALVPKETDEITNYSGCMVATIGSTGHRDSAAYTVTAGPPTPPSTVPRPEPTPVSTCALRPSTRTLIRTSSTEIAREASTRAATTMYSGPGGEIDETQAAAGITATAGSASQASLPHSICDQIRGSSRIGIVAPSMFASMIPSCAPISSTA